MGAEAAGCFLGRRWGMVLFAAGVFRGGETRPCVMDESALRTFDAEALPLVLGELLTVVEAVGGMVW